MKLIKIFLLFLVILQYTSCDSGSCKSKLKSKFEHNGVMINIDSLYYKSESVLGYQFEFNYNSNKILYKHYFKERGDNTSLEEWIDFDSLNRLVDIHTAIINCSSPCNDSISIQGNLLSTLKFDEAYCLIALEEEIVDIFKLDNKLRFYKSYKKNIMKDEEILNVEIFTVQNNEKDSSLSSLSIFKSYEKVNCNFNEIKVNKHNKFDNEKFNYMKTQYNYW